MTKEEELFHEIAAAIPGVQESKMFGALCIKAPNGKAGVMFWRNDMIFKLQAADEQAALGLKGVKIFEPMEGRPMGGWVQVPAAHASKWKKYADMAMEHVKKVEVTKKAKKSTKNK